MAYPNYNSQFIMQDLQGMRDRIDNQLRQYQQNQQQLQQQIPQPITQNFQLAPQSPTNNELESKYANNIEEVKNTFVMKTGVFVTKDFSIMWIKDVSGNIKTFETQEIIELDAKDKEIIELKKQIEEMKGMIINANKSDISNVDDEIADTKSKGVSANKRINAKQ